MIKINSKAAQIINDLWEAVDAPAISNILKDQLNKYWPDAHLPVPEVRIASHTKLGHLAHMVASVSKDLANVHRGQTFFKYNIKYYMEVERAAMADEETLKRVLAHEMIHYFLYNQLTPEELYNWGTSQKSMSPTMKWQNGHGPDFQKEMQRINTIEGREYVTLKATGEFKLEGKEYFLLIQPLPRLNTMGWTWAVRPSEQQKMEIVKRIEKDQAKLFRSKDPKWLKGIQPKPWGGASYAKNIDAAQELKRIYNSEQEVQI